MDFVISLLNLTFSYCMLVPMTLKHILYIIYLISHFRDIIELLQSISQSNYIIVSSVLPRAVDWNSTIVKVVQLNSELQNMCIFHEVEYLYTFSSFTRGIHPKRELFAVRDGGLHINFTGTQILLSMDRNLLQVNLLIYLKIVGTI